MQKKTLQGNGEPSSTPDLGSIYHGAHSKTLISSAIEFIKPLDQENDKLIASITGTRFSNVKKDNYYIQTVDYFGRDSSASKK